MKKNNVGEAKPTVELLTDVDNIAFLRKGFVVLLPQPLHWRKFATCA